MKSLFTIHAGEYLVGSHIEKEFKDARVWLPSKDTGIDLLVTNKELSKTVSLQVKFSKDFMEGKGGETNISKNIKSSGWWTFKHDKIKNSPADLWVLVLYSITQREPDFVVIEPAKLIELYRRLKRTSDSIQSYIRVTKNKGCWEVRDLGTAELEDIAVGVYKNPTRDLHAYLNNWELLKNKIGI